MDIIIQKFGGTSVANAENIKKVAHIIAATYKHNYVIVVVSAMAGITARLIKYTKEVSKLSNKEELSEYDTVIAAGEQVSAGLLSLALYNMGIKSQSYLGWQLPIYTDGRHSVGKITKINAQLLLEALQKNIIPIIAGFQGIFNNRLVTLGRGGSDTTAAAVAAATSAKRCDIYTDVKGVFTGDPREVKNTQKLKEITYLEMLAMASGGAKIIHPRAVRIAMKYNLDLHVLSTFELQAGTALVKNKNNIETEQVTSISSTSNIVSITLLNLMNDNFFVITQAIINLGIVIDFMIKHYHHKQSSDQCDINIIISNNEENLLCLHTLDLLMKKYSTVMILDNNLAKVSIIGIGIKDNLKIVNIIYTIIHRLKINLLASYSSEIKISLIIESKFRQRLVQELHFALIKDVTN